MSGHLNDVAEFHAAAEIADPDEQSVRDKRAYDLRYDLLREELGEYRDACLGGDLEGVLDALCDLHYVVLGTVLAHGLADVFDRAFAEVHRSNMTKFPGLKVLRRADGKILKPEGWTAPDLAQFISEAS